jgi:hypothetical protein
MNAGGTSASQSGSDWIITNKEGMMIRAQAKNSVKIYDEFESVGEIKLPQVLKL